MSIASPLFYFVLMAFMFAEGNLLSKVFPLHKEMDSDERNSNHLLSMDGLRGVLALSVFFCHASFYFYFNKTGQWAYPSSNFYAQLGVFSVTLFFFITGYLFWSKLMRPDHVPAIEFYLRRLVRLGPAYALACGIFFLLVAIVSRFHRHESLGKLVTEAALWLCFLSPNHDVNGIAQSKYWLGSAWTLRYEWMFYLSVPFLGWFARKRLGLVLLMAITTGIFLLGSVIHMQGRVGWLEDILMLYPFYLLFIFSVGMLVAQLRPNVAWIRRLQSPWATIASWTLIGVVLFFVAPAYGWLESLCLAVPFTCICFRNNWFGLLTSVPLRYLGRISYSFYLLHAPVLMGLGFATRKFLDVTAHGAIFYWAYIFFCGSVTVFASVFSYKYLEYPFLHSGKTRRVTKTDSYTAAPQKEQFLRSNAALR